MIETLETTHGRNLRKAESPLLYTILLHKPTNLEAVMVARSRTVVGEVAARVNHGRWIVDCPDEDCTAAVMASSDDPRFVCPVCAYGIFTVVFPSQAEAVEQALLERPVPATRNWTPDETVGDLRRENKEHLKPRGLDRKDR